MCLTSLLLNGDAKKGSSLVAGQIYFFDSSFLVVSCDEDSALKLR